MTLGHELKALDAKKSQVRDDMNDSESWSQGFRFYENLRAIDDMNDFELWA